MTKEYILSVDSGKFLTKAVLLEENDEHSKVIVDTFSIRTSIEETEETQTPIKNRAILTLNGVSTLMGAEDGLVTLERTKKSEEHKRSTYLAMSQLVPNNSHINLAIGTPITVHRQAEKLKEYQCFMLNLDLDLEKEIEYPVKIEFEINEVPYTYFINRLVTFAESSGYLIVNEESHEDDDLIGVVDIGGFNVNISIYTKEDLYNPESGWTIDLGSRTTTLDKGTHFLYAEIKKELAKEFSELPDQIIHLAAQKGVYGKSPEVQERSSKIISRVKEKFLKGIKTDLQKHNWEFEQTSIILVGGGSLLLKEAIENDPDLKHGLVSQNAQWENAIGFAYAMDDIIETN